MMPLPAADHQFDDVLVVVMTMAESFGPAEICALPSTGPANEGKASRVPKNNNRFINMIF